MLTSDSSSVAPPPAGWYGKLPVLGDFAQRRLPPEFIESWDAWLAAGLADWQARDDGWLDQYLASPTWRFVFSPGVIDALPGSRPQAWAGVLMPSCDRVGRYFPLCIAQALTLPTSGPRAQGLLDWLLKLDDLAVDALHEDWTVDKLEAELSRVAICDTEHAGPLSEQLLLLSPGQTLWITQGAQGEPVYRRHEGLPMVMGLFES